MKLKGDFLRREIAGETIYIPVGSASTEYNGIVAPNETADIIMRMLMSAASQEDIEMAILKEYDASPSQVQNDIAGFLNLLDEQGLLQK